MLRNFFLVTLIGMFCVVSHIAYGQEKEPTTSPLPGAAGGTLRVAAVQLRSAPDIGKNVSQIRSCLERAKADGVRVAAFPECALTGYFDPEYLQQITAEQLVQAEQQVASACRDLDMYAIIGTPTRDGSRLLNSAIVIDPQGRNYRAVPQSPTG